MNKEDLVNEIAQKTGLTKKDSKSALDAALESIKESLMLGDRVRLVDFGTFDVRQRKAREGRNPRNPEEVIHIPASKAPGFKPGKGLKEAVNSL